MTANPGGGDYRPDALNCPACGSGEFGDCVCDRLRESIGRLDARETGTAEAGTEAQRCGHPLGLYDLTCAAPPGHDGGHVGPFYVADARETGTDGITNLEGELAQLRAEVGDLRMVDNGRIAADLDWMDRAESAEGALTRVRVVVDEWLTMFGPGTEMERAFGQQSVSVEFAVREVRAALDGPVTSATSPSPASTGDTGTPAGSAPSDSPSEAQSDGSAS